MTAPERLLAMQDIATLFDAQRAASRTDQQVALSIRLDQADLVRPAVERRAQSFAQRLVVAEVEHSVVSRCVRVQSRVWMRSASVLKSRTSCSS